MNRIKILYIYHASGVGGGSFCLYNIIKQLDKKKYQPLVLLKSEGPLCEKLEALGAKVHIEKTISMVPYNKSIFNITSLKYLFYLFLSYFKIKHWITNLQPEIVYINTMMMYPYLRVAKILNKKTIIHVREHWPKKEHVFQFNLAKRNIEKYADRIIAINNTSASMLDFPEKTTVVYDWIDFSERDEAFSFEPIFGQNIDSLKIFTFTGGCESIKGAMEVVNAFSNNVLDENARLLILGSNTELVYTGFRGKIAKYLSIFNYDTYSNKVKKLILNDNRIVCLPANYKLKQIIEKSYCILSYFTIPHANLILAESIYLGQIVIAASTPEAIEYSNDGKSALLFKINDIIDFGEKIEKLCDNYEYYKQIANNGTEINKLLFDTSKNSLLLNDTYNTLMLN